MKLLQCLKPGTQQMFCGKLTPSPQNVGPTCQKLPETSSRRNHLFLGVDQKPSHAFGSGYQPVNGGYSFDHPGLAFPTGSTHSPDRRLNKQHSLSCKGPNVRSVFTKVKQSEFNQNYVYFFSTRMLFVTVAAIL